MNGQSDQRPDDSDAEHSESRAFGNFSEIASQRTRIVRAVDRLQLESSLQELNDSEREAALTARRVERERQIKRYQRASLAYIHSMLRQHPDDANDVWGRVVIKWLEGKLGTYNRQYSFRIYLKEILRNEVRAVFREYKRNNDHGPQRMASDFDPEDEGHQSASCAFDEEYRNTLLARAMTKVRSADERFYTVLQVQIEASLNGRKPPRAAALADLLEVSADNARAIRKRARDAYARAILDEIQEESGASDQAEIREILGELGLESYCRRVMDAQ